MGDTRTSGGLGPRVYFRGPTHSQIPAARGLPRAKYLRGASRAQGFTQTGASSRNLALKNVRAQTHWQASSESSPGVDERTTRAPSKEGPGGGH